MGTAAPAPPATTSSPQTTPALESLQGRPLITVTLRQPVSHHWQGRELVASHTARGWLRAVEPVVAASHGTWVALSSGDADHRVVNANGAVHIDAALGRYELRRLWLPPAWVRGHDAHTSHAGLRRLCDAQAAQGRAPRFDPEDWLAYQLVNQAFANAVAAATPEPEPVIVVHGHHFGLLPAMLRQRRPRATLVAFWHLPWPSVDRLALCPWQRALVQGLSANDVLGFQTEGDAVRFRQAMLRLRLPPACQRVQVGAFPLAMAWPPTTGPGPGRHDQSPAGRRGGLAQVHA